MSDARSYKLKQLETSKTENTTVVVGQTKLDNVFAESSVNTAQRQKIQNSQTKARNPDEVKDRRLGTIYLLRERESNQKYSGRWILAIKVGGIYRVLEIVW